MTTTVPAGEEQRVPRDLATRGTAIGERISGLEAAMKAARGRLDDALLDDVMRTVDRATGRLRLSATHTVVAIAGATGSGKSSTFNALTGLELSSTGVRRPTTSWATACVWGSEGAHELLEWLGIPPRHQTMRDSMLDTRRDDKALDGVVLMDLPDHDSTEVSHHLEVDRLVELADLIVWVLDPQKYADAAIHDRYFAPYRHHAGVMLVVLNHIDTIAEDRRQPMVDDVRRLLAADGLANVRVIPMSARLGIGVEDLRAEIVGRVNEKRATTARVEADVAAAAARLEEAGGAAPARELSTADTRAIEDRIADAAGVPAIGAAIEQRLRTRARLATTWPPFGLVSRLRMGSGRKHAAELGAGLEALAGGRAAGFDAAVQRPVVNTEVRALADRAADGLTPGWAASVRAAATDRLDETGDRLDAELGSVALGADRLPGWVSLARILQWLLLLAAIGGGAWMGWLAFQGTVDDAPEVAGLPLPAIVGVAGLVLGLLLAVVFAGLVGGLARRRAEAADAALRDAVHRVVDAEVVRPVADVLAAHATFRGGVARAVRND